MLSCFSCIQLLVTLWTVACHTSLSMGILQARILEWAAMPSYRGSSQARDGTQVSHIAGGFYTVWATREARLDEQFIYSLTYRRTGHLSSGMLVNHIKGLLIYSICWFLLCKYSHHGWFQANCIMPWSKDLEEFVHGQFCSLYQPALVLTLPSNNPRALSTYLAWPEHYCWYVILTF